LTREAAGPPVAIRRLSAADREAALTVINEAGRWYREFVPPAEYHEHEMTADDWDQEARRLSIPETRLRSSVTYEKKLPARSER